jgi:hypothetical protein
MSFLYYLQTQPLHFLIQCRLFFMHHEVVSVMLAAQCVSYDVCLAGVVVNAQVVVLN